jgi:predicted acylesterase/phospholipase RssA
MVTAAAEPAPVSTPRFDYPVAESPVCDVVMKGGVTSGVVYPLAICELATVYRFKSIGGTSAGAIAAVATAAAEYRRRKHGSVEGFELLERLPHWVGAPTRRDGRALDRTNLVSVFQPHPDTASVFDTAIAAIKRPRRKVLGLVGAGTRRFRLWALLGALPGLVVSAALALLLWAAFGPVPAAIVAAAALLTLLVSLFAIAPEPSSAPGDVPAAAQANGPGKASWIMVGAVAVLLTPLTLIAAGAAAGALAGLGRRAWRTLRPPLGFGLCPGGGHEPSGRHPLATDAPPAPLSVWLADLIDELAGEGTTHEPLTFGDLWWARDGAKPPVDDLRKMPERERTIHLATITTSLTLGRPYRLPFEATAFPGGNVPFYLREGELKTFFSGRVATFIEERAREKAEREGIAPPPGYLPFPDAPDVPVVFAARLSLSFPILLSAVPLYVLDDDGRPLRCWFSDGGIASNFPIHFFDAPLPRWPTFGINLRGPRAAHPSMEAWLDDYSDTTAESWEEIEDVRQFFDSLKDTMQNWLDNAQRRLPAGRDRIAQIPFAHDEGGLNLFMSGPVIDTLSERGRQAGALLRERFTEPQPDDEPSWEAHRWVRYRTSMRVLAGYLRALSRGWGEAPPGWGPPPDSDPLVTGTSYHDLLRRGPADPPAVLPWASEERRAQAQADTEQLVRLARAWANAFENAPILPEPDLRAAPRV